MSAFAKLVTAPDCDLGSPKRIRAGDPINAELTEFLEDEATLLDGDRFFEWLDLFTDDARYWMPVRVSVNRAMGDGFSRYMCYYNDTKMALGTRIQRLIGTKSAWVEDPPSRVSRFITGVKVFRTDTPDEFEVFSNLLLTRSRSDEGEVKLLSAMRHDTLRRTSDRVRIAKREIYLNQTTLDMHNVAIFL